MSVEKSHREMAAECVSLIRAECGPMSVRVWQVKAIVHALLAVADAIELAGTWKCRFCGTRNAGGAMVCVGCNQE